MKPRTGQGGSNARSVLAYARVYSQMIVFGCALFLAPSAAHSVEAPAIVLSVSESDQKLEVRLRAELEGLGFRVVTLHDETPSARKPLEDSARRAGAMAAVRIAPSEAGVEVWIVDRVTGKTVLREVVLEDRSAPHADATVALHTVELLRASLLELSLPDAPKGEVEAPKAAKSLLPHESSKPREAPPQAPPKSTPAIEARAPKRGFLGLGPALAVSPGGFGISVHALARGGYVFSGATAVCGWALLPTFTTRIESVEGSASTSLGFIGAGLEQHPKISERLELTAGAGVGAAWLHAVGAANQPYNGEVASVFAALPFINLGLGIALSSALELRLDGLGGFALPEPVLTFAGREVASWGRPLAVASVALEARL